MAFAKIPDLPPSYLWAALVVFLFSGCDNVDTGQYSDLNVEWSQLQDGSKFVNLKQDFTKHMTERCWPADNQWSCVHLYEDSETGILFGQRVERTKLPQKMFVSMEFDDGYECTHFTTIRESIDKGPDSVATNTLDYESRPWTPEYVEQFMQDNHIHGARYFDCITVFDAVLNASPAALGTTKITLDVLP